MVAKTRSKKSTFNQEKFSQECLRTDGSLFFLNAVYKKNTLKRIQYINELNVIQFDAAEIIRIFPQYRKHCELILHDYEKRVELLRGIKVKSIAEKFRRYASLILERDSNHNGILNVKWPTLAEQRQLFALELLPQLLVLNASNRSATRKKFSLLMEKPRSLTTRRFLSKIRKLPKRRAPLIVVIKKKPKLDLRLLVDNQLLKINGDPADALELFFAAHWTFNLKFDRTMKELMQFLSRMCGISNHSILKSKHNNLYDIFENFFQ